MKIEPKFGPRDVFLITILYLSTMFQNFDNFSSKQVNFHTSNNNTLLLYTLLFFCYALPEMRQLKMNFSFFYWQPKSNSHLLFLTCLDVLFTRIWFSGFIEQNKCPVFQGPPCKRMIHSTFSSQNLQFKRVFSTKHFTPWKSSQGPWKFQLFVETVHWSH